MMGRYLKHYKHDVGNGWTGHGVRLQCNRCGETTVVHANVNKHSTFSCGCLRQGMEHFTVIKGEEIEPES